jgi:hypothetical protein
VRIQFSQLVKSWLVSAEFLSTNNSNNLIPGSWPFHTNLVDFTSQADFQLTTELSQYFTSIHSTELLTNVTAARLVFPLSNLGADPTENTASKNPFIFIGVCSAIDWISFPGERVHRSVA